MQSIRKLVPPMPRFLRSSSTTQLHHCVLPRALFSTNTTYSGGQPFNGQGGYYGSLESRSEKHGFQPGSCVSEEDRQQLREIMNQVQVLKSSGKEGKELSSEVKAMLSNGPVTDLFKRLDVTGSPAWGLSSDERDFVKFAKNATM